MELTNSTVTNDVAF